MFYKITPTPNLKLKKLSKNAEKNVFKNFNIKNYKSLLEDELFN